MFLKSHLLGEVEATCDRVAFIKQGRTVQELSLARLTVDLEVELKLDEAGPSVLEGLARFGREVAHVGGLVRLRIDREETIPELAGWIVEQGRQLYALQSRRRSLEQLFLEVMGEDQRPG